MIFWEDLAWPLRTERLELAPATAADADAVFAYRSLPDVARWNMSWPQDPAAFASDWQLMWQRHLMVRRDGEVIGDVMLRTGDAWAQVDVKEAAAGTQAELGYVLSPEFHGHGYATEAARAALDLAFGVLGLRRVVAECFAANEPSWRLLERVGMRREAHNVADSLHRDLGWVDGYVYALLADEWRAAH